MGADFTVADGMAVADGSDELNIRTLANALRHGSEIIEDLIGRDQLLVVGAEYSLDTGVVEFFDGMP